jgi:hypothetical protein
MNRAEKIGSLVGGLGVIVAVAAWLFPFPPANGDPTATEPVPSTTRSGSTDRTPSPAAGAPAVAYLHELAPQSGGASLVALPRQVRGLPGYERALAIGCPTNQSEDKERSVTFLLRGRYLQLTATVRPYFRTDPEAASHVQAVAGVRERDDTLTREVRGAQYEALTTRPGTLTADIEGADELTIHVRCGHPDGVVILTDARITRA